MIKLKFVFMSFALLFSGCKKSTTDNKTSTPSTKQMEKRIASQINLSVPKSERELILGLVDEGLLLRGLDEEIKGKIKGRIRAEAATLGNQPANMQNVTQKAVQIVGKTITDINTEAELHLLLAGLTPAENTAIFEALIKGMVDTLSDNLGSFVTLNGTLSRMLANPGKSSRAKNGFEPVINELQGVFGTLLSYIGRSFKTIPMEIDGEVITGGDNPKAIQKLTAHYIKVTETAMLAEVKEIQLEIRSGLSNIKGIETILLGGGFKISLDVGRILSKATSLFVNEVSEAFEELTASLHTMVINDWLKLYVDEASLVNWDGLFSSKSVGDGIESQIFYKMEVWAAEEETFEEFHKTWLTSVRGFVEGLPLLCPDWFNEEGEYVDAELVSEAAVSAECSNFQRYIETVEGVFINEFIRHFGKIVSFADTEEYVLASYSAAEEFQLIETSTADQEQIYDFMLLSLLGKIRTSLADQFGDANASTLLETIGNADFLLDQALAKPGLSEEYYTPRKAELFRRVYDDRTTFPSLTKEEVMDSCFAFDSNIITATESVASEGFYNFESAFYTVSDAMDGIKGDVDFGNEADQIAVYMCLAKLTILRVPSFVLKEKEFTEVISGILFATARFYLDIADEKASQDTLVEEINTTLTQLEGLYDIEIEGFSSDSADAYEILDDTTKVLATKALAFVDEFVINLEREDPFTLEVPDLDPSKLVDFLFDAPLDEISMFWTETFPEEE